ncbi:hypothetical protein FKP32DRAFT_1592750 [Trametes sanguinea]|nr:hypothetical protein FKP32DRAFT_1592750 [Trametes sanguinea]
MDPLYSARQRRGPPRNLGLLKRVSGYRDVPVYWCTSVAVYGAVKPVGVWQMQSIYFLDALGDGTYQPNPVVSSEQHHVLFYASHQLAYGPHTLVIENQGEQFWFDYIVVGGQGDGPATSCATPAPLSSSSQSVIPASSSSLRIGQSASSGQHLSSSLSMHPSSVKSASISVSSVNASTVSSASSKSNDSLSSAIVTVSMVPNLQSSSATASKTTVPSSMPLVTSTSAAPSETAGNVTGNRLRGTAALSPGTVAGIVVSGTTVALVVLVAAVLLHHRLELVRARTMITPFDANSPAGHRPLRPPSWDSVAKPPPSMSTSPVIHHIDLLELTSPDPEAQPQPFTLPPPVRPRDRVLNISHGGTGTWVDSWSSSASHAGLGRASLTTWAAAWTRGRREREAEHTWMTSKGVVGSSVGGMPQDEARFLAW